MGNLRVTIIQWDGLYLLKEVQGIALMIEIIISLGSKDLVAWNSCHFFHEDHWESYVPFSFSFTFYEIFRMN